VNENPTKPILELSKIAFNQGKQNGKERGTQGKQYGPIRIAWKDDIMLFHKPYGKRGRERWKTGGTKTPSWDQQPIQNQRILEDKQIPSVKSTGRKEGKKRTLAYEFKAGNPERDLSGNRGKGRENNKGCEKREASKWVEKAAKVQRKRIKKMKKTTRQRNYHSLRQPRRDLSKKQMRGKKGREKSVGGWP